MSKYFVIGKIVNTQGLKGEVRALPFTDDIKRFELLKEVFLSIKGSLKSYKIENVRFHKKFVLLKFENIDDINDAERLKNTEIKIPEELALPCSKDEYYIRDLYGLNVITKDNEHLGTLVDIIFTGANDVYVVENKEKQILIPAIKKCILNIDLQNKIMTVSLLEGLL